MAGDYFLTINGLKLHRFGFCIARDLTDFLTPGPLEGDDWASDGVDGVVFRPKVQGPLYGWAQLQVRGKVDSDGIPRADTGWGGIEANLADIRAACVTASKSVLVAATITYPGGAVRSANVYCPRLQQGLQDDDRSGAAVAASLEIIVPAGAFT